VLYAKKHEKSKKNDLLAAADGPNCIFIKKNKAIYLRIFFSTNLNHNKTCIAPGALDSRSMDSFIKIGKSLKNIETINEQLE
jgi:hypothetical protein